MSWILSANCRAVAGDIQRSESPMLTCRQALRPACVPVRFGSSSMVIFGTLIGLPLSRRCRIGIERRRLAGVWVGHGLSAPTPRGSGPRSDRWSCSTCCRTAVRVVLAWTVVARRRRIRSLWRGSTSVVRGARDSGRPRTVPRTQRRRSARGLPLVHRPVGGLFPYGVRIRQAVGQGVGLA